MLEVTVKVEEMYLLDDEDEETTPPVLPKEEEAKKPKQKGKASDERDKLYEAALAELGGTEAVDFSVFGTKSDTLTFIKPIGRNSVKSSYTDRAQIPHSCPDVIGGRFVSTEPIVVPVVPAEQTPETGFDLAQVTYREVAANENFDITLMEAVLLLTQDEYAMQFMYDGKAGIGGITGRFAALASGSKLPTPYLVVNKVSIKADQLEVDEKIDDVWVVKEEFARFEPFVLNGTQSSTSVSRAKPTQSVAIKNTLAFRQIMGNLKK